jgi:hypothetical protein
VAESTGTTARSSGSVIGGRSIGRPLRVCQIVSYSVWTCCQGGSAGMSMPKKRRHVSALSRLGS